MIGREGPVDHFKLMRWARRMASACALKPIEAHILIVLASYANEKGEAWPQIKTLTRDCGRTPTPTGSNSAISTALGSLQKKELIWTRGGGKGRPATRELLFDHRFPMRPAPGWESLPYTDVDGIGPLESGPVDVNGALESTGVDGTNGLGIHDTGRLPSTGVDAEEPVEEPVTKNKNQTEEPERNPRAWIPCHPEEWMEEPTSEFVRRQIEKSLREAAA